MMSSFVVSGLFSASVICLIFELLLHRQCFVLSNNMSQLLKQWNLPPTTPEETLKSRTSSETQTELPPR